MYRQHLIVHASRGVRCIGVKCDAVLIFRKARPGLQEPPSAAGKSRRIEQKEPVRFREILKKCEKLRTGIADVFAALAAAERTGKHQIGAVRAVPPDQQQFSVAERLRTDLLRPEQFLPVLPGEPPADLTVEGRHIHKTGAFRRRIETVPAVVQKLRKGLSCDARRHARGILKDAVEICEGIQFLPGNGRSARLQGRAFRRRFRPLSRIGPGLLFRRLLPGLRFFPQLLQICKDHFIKECSGPVPCGGQRQILRVAGNADIGSGRSSALHFKDNFKIRRTSGGNGLRIIDPAAGDGVSAGHIGAAAGDRQGNGERPPVFGAVIPDGIAVFHRLAGRNERFFPGQDRKRHFHAGIAQTGPGRIRQRKGGPDSRFIAVIRALRQRAQQRDLRFRRLKELRDLSGMQRTFVRSVSSVRPDRPGVGRLSVRAGDPL